MIFKTGVGFSKRQDPKKAGEEVVATALEEIKHRPKFFLLYSTIHYENQKGGIKAFLESAFHHLPSGVPLIGGTVAGFSNKYGCYTRGATGLAVYSDKLDVAVGIGHNTKRNPREAGRSASSQILKKLKKSRYKSSFLIAVISGPTLPRSKIFGTMRIIRSRQYSKLLSKLTKISTIVNQVGLGRESEVLDALCEGMSNYSLIGISSNDNNKYLNHYQFYNDNVLKNSIVAIGVKSNFRVFVTGTHGLIPTGKTAKITGTENWRYVIKTLDEKPAVDVYFKKTGIAPGIINEKNIHRITPFLPLGCYHRDGTLHPYPVASFLGDYLLLGHNAVSDEIEFFKASGRSLIGAVDEALATAPKKPKFVLVSSCAARLETLGDKVYVVRDKLMKQYGENFLLLYGLGEQRKGVGSPHHLQETFNMLSIY